MIYVISSGWIEVSLCRYKSMNLVYITNSNIINLIITAIKNLYIHLFAEFQVVNHHSFREKGKNILVAIAKNINISPCRLTKKYYYYL